MPAVDLEPNEWGQVMAILATAPWRDANPLLMKIGQQLQAHNFRPPEADPRVERPEGNGQEARHE